MEEIGEVAQMSFKEILGKVNPLPQVPLFIPTRWSNLNGIIGGGIPLGKIVKIKGRSQIGKTAAALHLIPDYPIILFDLDRKLCLEYCTKSNIGQNIRIVQEFNDNVLFSVIYELIKLECIIIIDSLAMIGTMEDERERFYWLNSKFLELQRKLISSKSSVILLNQLRAAPSTGRMYDPSGTSVDCALELEMQFAEMRGRDQLVYVNVTKSFWGQEGERCTLIVGKDFVREFIPLTRRRDEISSDEVLSNREGSGGEGISTDY